MSRIALIVNPVSGGGRGARRADATRRALAAGWPDLLTLRTAQAGDEPRLVRQALEAGVDAVVALGGDGTWSKCAAALHARGAREVALACVAAGTGNDFVKALARGTHDAVTVAARLADPGARRRIDLGRVEERHFLNVAGFGFDAQVALAMEGSSKRAGALAYLGEALRQLLGYQGLEGAVPGLGHARWLMLVFANGTHFGGAFPIAPRADAGDGALDVVAVRAVSASRRPLVLAKAVLGRHLHDAAVHWTRGVAWTLSFPEPPVVELDGEPHRLATCEPTVAVVPGAITVVAPPLRSPERP